MARSDNSTPAPQRDRTTDSDGTDAPIVWPDPSPLDSWWRQVMSRGDGSTQRRAVAR